MRDDILAGLKNAVERGASIEQAVQSFISAGYNPSEIKEAAERLSQGTNSIVNSQQTTKITPASVQPPLNASPDQAKPEVKNSNNLQSAELPQKSNKQVPENNVFTGTPNKILYVPGAQNKTVQQPSQVMQNTGQSSGKPIEYIPFEGVDSTRKKKIILLLGFLILLVGLLIIAIFYNQQIFDFLKKFYK